ncbi:unnamed protein product [Choristocarpus tenellus]
MASFVEEQGLRKGSENRPVQLVKTGDAEDNYSFKLCEENLDRVLAKVPKGVEVSVVSVVGAFRTGKSFLLSFFLRYLKSGSGDDPSEAWITADGTSLREGNLNVGQNGDAESYPQSFQWRGGSDRMTTGIWMWSEPFLRRVANGTTVAVLLVDTQGMFDNETSMGLTTCIFALSTLLSSCQIYNVEKRIQEDHLQQLALFSEYGRMAIDLEGDGDDAMPKYTVGDCVVKGAGPGAGDVNGEKVLGAGAGAGAGVPEEALKGGKNRNGGVLGKATTSFKGAATAVLAAQNVIRIGSGLVQSEVSTSQDYKERPFQRLEFLVRDWQVGDAGALV